MFSRYPEIPVKRVNPDAPMPVYAHEGDAGLDLCAMEDVTLRPGEWAKIGSGIAMAIPNGYVGYVYPRSGLGCKGLVLKNGTGVIDSTYRGEIGLTLFNNNPQLVEEFEYPSSRRVFRRIYAWLIKHMGYDMSKGREPMVLVPNTSGDITIHKGDRVAQLVIEQCCQSTLMKVDELDDTSRGSSGFGASGLRYERL